MSLSLVGRRGGRRVILWRRVCGRALGAVLGTILLVLFVSCVLVSPTEEPFFQMWWGSHLFLLLLALPALALLLRVVVPLLRRALLPLDRLPDLDAPPGEAAVAGHSRWAGARRGLVAVLVVAFLVGLFYVEENWRGLHAWKRYQRQQEARGERLEPSALVPPPVPVEQNFAATPFLAGLLKPSPRVSRYQDIGESRRLHNLAPLFDDAAENVKPSTAPRSNSWVVAETDLPAWYAAFLKGTNASELDSTMLTNVNSAAQEAFARRYGMQRRAAPVTTAKPPAPASPAQTNIPTRIEAAKGVLTALSECEPVLTELRAASRRPLSRFDVRYDAENPADIPMYHYAILKRLCKVLQLRASAELALGQTEQAFDDVNLIFRLTDANRDEPLLIAQLVRVGESRLALQPLAEGLARHQWSEAQLRVLEERLGQFDFCADGRRALQGERVIFGGGVIDFVRRSPHRFRAFDCLGGTPEGNDGSSFDLRSLLLQAVPSGWFHLEKLNYSRTFGDYVLPAINVPDRRVSPEACRKSEEQISLMLSDPWPVLVLRHRVFSCILLPALSRAVQKVAFAQTGADAAVLACALERYRLARGNFPEALGVLAPEFISQVPHDVINGQPLKYHRTADGQYVLYSVGWNQTNDGGALELTKSGTGIKQAEGDWVWRLQP